MDINQDQVSRSGLYTRQYALVEKNSIYMLTYLIIIDPPQEKTCYLLLFQTTFILFF